MSLLTHILWDFNQKRVEALAYYFWKVVDVSCLENGIDTAAIVFGDGCLHI